MGSGRRHRLLERRALLLQRSDALRLQFGAESRVLEPPLGWIDEARAGLNWLRRNPAWPVGAITVVLVARPRGVVRWSGRAFGAWRLWRKLRTWMPIVGSALFAQR